MHFDLNKSNVNNEQNNINLESLIKKTQKTQKKHHESSANNKRPLSKEHNILQNDTHVLQKS